MVGGGGGGGVGGLRPWQYEAVGDVDKVGSRPDFAVLVYPAGLEDKGGTRLREDVKVTKETPPMFFVHAFDDNVSVLNTLLLATELKKSGVSAEVHVYATGGHGYGLRHVDGQPVTDWPKPCEAWLRGKGLIGAIR